MARSRSGLLVAAVAAAAVHLHVLGVTALASGPYGSVAWPYHPDYDVNTVTGVVKKDLDPTLAGWNVLAIGTESVFGFEFAVPATVDDWDYWMGGFVVAPDIHSVSTAKVIAFGIYPNLHATADPVVEVYESGTNKGTFAPPAAAGELFRVEYDPSIARVRYWRNSAAGGEAGLFNFYNSTWPVTSFGAAGAGPRLYPALAFGGANSQAHGVKSMDAPFAYSVCPPLTESDIPNADPAALAADCASKQTGSGCNVRCASGFHETTSRLARCVFSGTGARWDDFGAPVCSPAPCTQPPAFPLHSEGHCGNLTHPVPHLGECSVTCAPSFGPAAVSQTITCSHGAWTQPAQTCTIVEENRGVVVQDSMSVVDLAGNLVLRDGPGGPTVLSGELSVAGDALIQAPHTLQVQGVDILRAVEDLQFEVQKLWARVNELSG